MNRPTETVPSKTMVENLRKFATEQLPMPWTFSRQVAIQNALSEASNEIERLLTLAQRVHVVLADSIVTNQVMKARQLLAAGIAGHADEKEAHHMPELAHCEHGIPVSSPSACPSCHASENGSESLP